MKLLSLTSILSLLITAQAWGSVKAYFNNNSKTSYTDPYRGITRQGDNLEAIVLENIRSAKKSIFLAVQELRLPLVAAALIEKRNAGVDVRIVLEHDYNFTVLTQRDTAPEDEYEATKVNELRAIVDANGDSRISKEELETRDAIYMLHNAKVPVIDDSFDNSLGSGLMHHKFMIIDGKTTIVSSANFTLSCVHGDILSKGSRGNANSMVVISSQPVAAIFEEEFRQIWGNGRRGNFGHNKTYRGPQTVTVRGTKITVQFSPTSARYNWEESVNGLIASHLFRATNSIKGALFVFSDQTLSNILERMHDLGVEMGFLIESKFAFREYSELLDMAGIQMLNGKCTYEPDNKPWNRPVTEIGTASLSKGDVLHHKFAVIDNKTVIIGSQNWSNAANYVNDENVIIIQNKEISDQYTQEYNRLKSGSRRGIPSSVRTEIERIQENCWGRGVYF